MNHLIKDFEFTIQQHNYEEVQEVTDKQGLSQMDTKTMRKRTRIPTTSMYASSSRLNTKSKIKGP